MGTHLKVLGESFQMDTNMTGFGCFSKILRSCGLDESSSLSIGRVNAGDRAIAGLSNRAPGSQFW